MRRGLVEMRILRFMVVGIVLGLVATACTSGGEGIEIEDAWGRAAPVETGSTREGSHECCLLEDVTFHGCND
jgi:hypothetical protein